MGMFRTSRPMMIDARQFTQAGTITTDLGFVNVKSGEWVINGESGECYVVGDAFFQRTFTAVTDGPELDGLSGDHRLRARRADLVRTLRKRLRERGSRRVVRRGILRAS